MNSNFLKLPSSMYINHMESDRLSNGEILFSANFIALHTTDGNNISDVFDLWAVDRISITGFTQTSEYDIVFVGQYNHCLRIYNRLQGTVNKFAGNCNGWGFRDGTDALLYWPTSVVQDNQIPYLFYVIDYFNAALRMVTKSYRHAPLVTTLLTCYYKSYRHLTQDPSGRYLYITYAKGLERYDLTTNTSIDIVSQSARHPNDALMYDGAIVDLGGITLYRDWVLIADSRRYVLFVVDLTTNTTSTICTGVSGHRSGNSSNCQINLPTSLLELNGDIYVGEKGGISVLRGTCIYRINYHLF